MDWNRDGKVDKKDAWIYHNAIKPKSEGTNEGEGSGRTSQDIHKKDSSGSNFELTELGSVVLGLLFIIVIAFLCLGHIDMLDTLFGLGIIVFLIAQWLDS